mmetsp:Transcript_65073/g.173420  ORF Transcript_65073/g.173420 Transcript_65073/m.173420 type:complete len:412 (+) Transcript_65073:122-1357(+)
MLVAWIVSTYRRKKALEAAAVELIQNQVNEGIGIVNQIQAPMVLMKGSDFVKLDGLEQHEALRDRGLLVFVDTVEAFLNLYQKKYITVFFSHQWLAFASPDPEKKQFALMCSAAQQIAIKEQRSLDDVYVWVDVFSIPQSCRPVQRLAINSLPALASLAKYFVTICPSIAHVDTKGTCDRHTYFKRCWCRAEVMSFWARNGVDQMYYADDNEGELKQMAPGGITHEFIESVQVFQGDLTCCRLCHNDGADICDREELMLPMLGLYAEIYKNRDTPSVKPIFEAIETNRHQIYPATFQYANGTEVFEKPLFGDLIDVMRHSIDEALGHTSTKVVNYGKLRAGSSKDARAPGSRHGSKHGSKHGSSKHGSTSVESSGFDRETSSRVSRRSAGSTLKAPVVVVSDISLSSSTAE